MGGYILISVLILITCILLILVVLVQNSKGGGLASNFSGSNQFMGVRKTADFLEKSTWTLAIFLLVLSLSTSFVIPRRQAGEQVKQSAISEEAQQSSPAVDPNFTMPPGQEQLPSQPQEN
ncbi:MAG: preprotein translocase subunit SecG [Bacteroidales bacterium]|nr:preprotein translocase subunit SecG [Bacteroidales bacterium]MCF8352585.1 preprotein translocase subunit SecG [Bacteroidales bacterium]MCF8376442.1 preprotein translocase subunit SecG [Bacteroidales bacterium]MCF8400561.1 preprotein translocase subunit SecG [Bacteroidales bacterium]